MTKYFPIKVFDFDNHIAGKLYGSHKLMFLIPTTARVHLIAIREVSNKGKERSRGNMFQKIKQKMQC